MSAYDQLRSPNESIEEQARRKGIKPVDNIADMACDIFESDEEMEEFIAFTYRCRRENHA
jgi:hypothetical protein